MLLKLEHPQDGILREDIGYQILAYLRFLYGAIPCHVRSPEPFRRETPLSLTKKARV
jgi:hypothetical protein